MIKHILFTSTIFLSLGGLVSAQQSKKANEGSGKTEVKFLEDISVSAAPAVQTTSDPKAVFSESLFTSSKPAVPVPSAVTSIEKASQLQLKYAVLLDTEVEDVQNIGLYNTIDTWYGTRYRLGGTTKEGIDCSALMQTMFQSLYSISLPRTAREQYHYSRRISRAELKEGDLVFFNTVGGVSHVGMYLQNNKFIHASSGGVTVSDLFDEYWMRKFIGAGRVEIQLTASTTNP